MTQIEGRLAELGGIEYSVTPCGPCKGTGRRFDPTLADNVHSSTHGMITCPHCDGKGEQYRITSKGMREQQARFEERMKQR